MNKVDKNSSRHGGWQVMDVLTQGTANGSMSVGSQEE